MQLPSADIESLRVLLRTLTWKKIFQLVVLICIIAASIVAFETRDVLYNKISTINNSTTSIESRKLSDKGIMLINSVIEKNDIIAGISITSVDLQRNIGKTIFYSIPDADLVKVFRAYSESSYAEFPVFSTDAAGSSRMVSIINGVFTCELFDNTAFSLKVPEGSKYISTVCYNAIPPYYGKFSGYVTVYLRRPPRLDENDTLKNIIVNLSAEVFSSDFK